MMTPEERMLRLRLYGAIALALVAGSLLAWGLISDVQWVQVVVGAWPK